MPSHTDNETKDKDDNTCNKATNTTPTMKTSRTNSATGQQGPNQQKLQQLPTGWRRTNRPVEETTCSTQQCQAQVRIVPGGKLNHVLRTPVPQASKEGGKTPTGPQTTTPATENRKELSRNGGAEGHLQPQERASQRQDREERRSNKRWDNRTQPTTPTRTIRRATTRTQMGTKRPCPSCLPDYISCHDSAPFPGLLDYISLKRYPAHPRPCPPCCLALLTTGQPDKIGNI